MEFSEEELVNLLKTNSETLASIIVTNRIMGCYKQTAKQCMIELMKRRLNGDDFNYEEFIATKTKEHQFTINIKTISNLQNMIGREMATSIMEGLTESIDGLTDFKENSNSDIIDPDIDPNPDIVA